MIFSVRKRKTSILHCYRAEREEKQQATHFVFFSSAYKQTYDKVKKTKGIDFSIPFCFMD